MKNYTLLEKVSLPTNNEQKIISLIGKSNRSNRNKAQLLTFTNSLILAKADVEEYQLYAMLLKNYILNKFSGKIKVNIELDEIINSIDIENEELVEENICFLIQYLNVDDLSRFKLATNFIETLEDKDIQSKGIKGSDKYTCLMLCNNLNNMIEAKVKANNKTRKRIAYKYEEPIHYGQYTK